MELNTTSCSVKRAVARLVTGINSRGWGLRRALYEAAVSDQQLQAKVHELEGSQRVNLREGIELVTGRPADDEVLDALWVLLGADAFFLLTQVGGRSMPEYERWLAEIIHRLLTRNVS